jgi:hypothetical protein
LPDRAHFFGVAARLMREIDHGRSRRAAKRDFGYKVTLDEAVAGSPKQDLDLLALDDALNETHAPRFPRSREVEEL